MSSQSRRLYTDRSVSCRATWRLAVGLTLLVVGTLCVSPPAKGESPAADPGSQSARPAAAGAAGEKWQTRVQQDIQESEYLVSWQDGARLERPDGARQAPNRTLGAKGPTQTLDLAQTETQLISGTTLRQTTLDHTADDLEPVEFLRTHRQVSRVLDVGLQDRHGA